MAGAGSGNTPGGAPTSVVLSSPVNAVDEFSVVFTAGENAILAVPGNLYRLGGVTSSPIAVNRDFVRAEANPGQQTTVEIPGSGFDADTAVQVGAQGCWIYARQASSTSLRFQLAIRPGVPDGDYDIVLHNFGQPPLVLANALRISGSLAPASVVTVSAASFTRPIAPAALAAVFGAQLSKNAVQASPGTNGHYPTQVDGTTVTVGGSKAELLYVSPGQINFLMPNGLQGPAAVAVASNSSGASSAGSANVRRSAPAVFTNDGSGGGAGAILNAVTYAPGPFGVVTAENPGDDKRTRLAVFGTGLRGAKSSVAMAVDPSGTGWILPVEYAGPVSGYAGLDQVNLVLPAGLDGAGDYVLTLVADYVESNAVSFSVR